MGVANQLGKFSHGLSEASQLLRQLFSPKRAWLWGLDQERASQGGVNQTNTLQPLSKNQGIS